jgi:hypothetical protein
LSFQENDGPYSISGGYYPIFGYGRRNPSVDESGQGFPTILAYGKKLKTSKMEITEKLALRHSEIFFRPF